MAKLGINTTPPLGTPLPDGGGNINSNFDELYTLLGDGNELYPGIVTSITAGSNISISTSYGNVSIAVSSAAFTETLDSVTDRGNVTNNGIRVGVATASAFVKSGGTASQFLKADGSVDNNTYLTSSSTISLTLDEVTTNGNTTANNISVGGLAALGNVAAGASILAVNAAIASSFRRIGGSSTEFLKGDGTVDTNSYATVAYVDTNAGYWVQDTVGINTTSNVGIGTSAGAETLIVGGDARILGILTVGSASVTIDGDSETISVGNTVSIGNSAIHVGTGVTITEDAILVGTGITISSTTNQIFIQGEEVIDRWKIGAVGISTTNEVGIGTTAKADYQLDVLGDTRITGNLVLDGPISGIVTQITAGDGISIDPISGKGSVRITAVGSTSLVGSLQQVTDNGDETTNTITAAGFIKFGGASNEFLKADGTVDNTIYASTVLLNAETSARQQGDAELETKIGLSTAGLASIVYVDNAIGLATAGISTQGLATIAYVDNAVAGISTAGLASIVYVDEQVGLATAGISTEGLASIVYVDSKVGLATAGISTAGLASIAYVDNLVAISTAGLGTGGGVGAAVTISDTAPGSPSEGDLWWDSTRGTGFIYYTDTNSSQWVEFCPGGSGGGSGAGSTEVTKVYVDNLVAISTSGLANTEYVDNKVAISTAGISTSGLASIAYVDNAVAGVVGGATTTTWTLGAQGTDNYTFDGPGFDGPTPDPNLTLMRGQKYNFVNNMNAHPFRIQSTQGTSGTPYNDGITNNGVSNGTLEWDVQFDSPDTLYYQCTAHPNMQGEIYIVGAANTTGLASEAYVDNLVAISTTGLASISYVDNAVGLSTAGISTLGLASIVYVDNKVGLATAGLASETYVDNKVGLATAGLSSDLQSVTDLGDTTTATITANGFECNDVTIGDGNVAITGFSNTLNYFTCTGKDNQVDFRVQKDHVKVGSSARNASLEIWGDVVGYSSITADRFYGQGLLPSRTIVSGTTASLNDLEIGNVDIEGFKSYNLMKVGLSTAGWLRLYTDSTSRANDASRSIGIDPAPGIGVIAEVVTTGVSTTQIISPFVAGGNLDEPATNTIYASVKNLTGQTSTISIDLTLLQLEE